MAQRSLSISISMPTEMDKNVQEAAEEHGLTYSEYVRHCIRSYSSNPIEEPNVYLARDENGENASRNEGAA
jgi:predicted DNA-binding protein